MDTEEDLSPEEKKMFTKLSREAAYNPALENNIIDQLRKEGLICKDRSKVKLVLRWAAIFILSMGFFLAGLFYGFNSKPKENYSYVFLLRNSTNLDGNSKERFREYQEWREGVEQQGIAITGEKLSTSIAMIGKAEESTSPISGFFMLFAESDDEALKLARENPHIKNGGFIEIRKIVNQ